MMMNPSRNSYTCPMSIIDFPVDVILHPCEFCKRTFIPDSLAKHRKVCYRNYLKQRTKMSRKSSGRSRGNRSSTGDLPLLQLNELMLKRQERRMNWRNRHTDFIQTIRAAREYAMAVVDGADIPQPPPSINTDAKDDLELCRYCLRKFHKDAYARHCQRCREHSIQNSRSRPNQAQIEAKRRLSVRLYYKPRSFRGDSPDDNTTSLSSNEIDCPSLTSTNSVKMPSELSKISCRSAMSATAATKSRPVTKSQSMVRRHETTVSAAGTGPGGAPKLTRSNSVRGQTKSTRDRKTPIPGYSGGVSISVTEAELAQRRGGSSSTSNVNNGNNVTATADSRNELHKIRRKSERLRRSKSIVNVTESVQPLLPAVARTIQETSGNKKSPQVRQRMRQISALLNNPPQPLPHEDSAMSECGDQPTTGKPDPAESLRQAKDVLRFLFQREQHRESSRILEPEIGRPCDRDKGNVQQQQQQQQPQPYNPANDNPNSQYDAESGEVMQIQRPSRHTTIKSVSAELTTSGGKELHPSALTRPRHTDRDSSLRATTASSVPAVTLRDSVPVVKIDTTTNNANNTACDTALKMTPPTLSLENINSIYKLPQINRPQSQFRDPGAQLTSQILPYRQDPEPVPRCKSPYIPSTNSSNHPDPEYARVWQRSSLLRSN